MEVKMKIFSDKPSNGLNLFYSVCRCVKFFTFFPSFLGFTLSGPWPCNTAKKLTLLLDIVVRFGSVNVMAMLWCCSIFIGMTDAAQLLAPSSSMFQCRGALSRLTMVVVWECFCHRVLSWGRLLVFCYSSFRHGNAPLMVFVWCFLRSGLGLSFYLIVVEVQFFFPFFSHGLEWMHFFEDVENQFFIVSGIKSSQIMFIFLSGISFVNFEKLAYVQKTKAESLWMGGKHAVWSQSNSCVVNLCLGKETIGGRWTGGAWRRSCPGRMAGSFSPNENALVGNLPRIWKDNSWVNQNLSTNKRKCISSSSKFQWFSSLFIIIIITFIKMTK